MQEPIRQAERAIEDQILEWESMARGARVALGFVRDSFSMVSESVEAKDDDPPLVDPVSLGSVKAESPTSDEHLFEGEPIPLVTHLDPEDLTVSLDEPGRLHPLDPYANDGLVGEPLVNDLDDAARQALTEEGFDLSAEDRIWIQDGQPPAYGDESPLASSITE